MVWVAVAFELDMVNCLGFVFCCWFTFCLIWVLVGLFGWMLWSGLLFIHFVYCLLFGLLCLGFVDVNGVCCFGF